jgi:hypothetical protein
MMVIVHELMLYHEAMMLLMMPLSEEGYKEVVTIVSAK